MFSRYPLAMLAGLLLACAFPNLSIAGLAWLVPGLILLIAIGQPPKQVFRLGFVAGFAHRLASLAWLLNIPVAWVPMLGWAALSAYCALYTGVWTWLCWRAFPVSLPGLSGNQGLRQLSQAFLSTSWSQRFMWALHGAMFWVGLELLISRLFSGFPWNLLGASQYTLVPLLHIASVTGIYGISFLLVWSSLSLVCAVMAIVARPGNRSAWVAEIILPMSVVGLIYGLGYSRALAPEPKRPELSIAMIQPSIPQTMIWSDSENSNRFRQVLELSLESLTNHPDLMIWPEAAVPGILRFDEDIAKPISDLARTNHIPIILGADDAKPLEGARTFQGADFYNASFLIGPDGRLGSVYKKRNLVIFGEYIPLVKWFPFIKYLTPIPGAFTPGESPVPFRLPNPQFNVSVLICFEDGFPDLVREYVSEDTDFLVNITNDGWFGEASAQRQQAAAAVFRAVENGVPLLRCANTGLTCWIDEQGRIRQFFSSPNGGIYGRGFLIARVPSLVPGQHRRMTFYHQHGDVFGWICFGVTALRILRIVISSRRQRRESIAVTPPEAAAKG